MSQIADSSIDTKKENLHWTPNMDSLFIEEMLYQTRQGNRPDGTFTTAAYKNMLDNLREKLELPNLQAKHLKNRIKKLKSNFSECYDLFRGKYNSGFNWNAVSRVWTAEPECWKDLIQAHPKASKWRTKPINHYDKLEELFAKDRATGDGAETAKEKLKRWATSSEKEMDIDDIDKLVSHNEVSLENFVDLDGAEEFPPTSTTQAQSSTGATSKAKKRKVVRSSNNQDDDFNSLFSRVVEVINVGNENLVNALKSSQSHAYTSNEIYKELVLLELEEPFLEDAYDWLLENDKMVRKFFGYPQEKRKTALEKMMNVSKS